MLLKYCIFLYLILVIPKTTKSQIWKYIWINETKNFGWIFINETLVTTTELPIPTTTLSSNYQLCSHCGHFGTEKSTTKQPIVLTFTSSLASSSFKKPKLSSQLARSASVPEITWYSPLSPPPISSSPPLPVPSTSKLSSSQQQQEKYYNYYKQKQQAKKNEQLQAKTQKQNQSQTQTNLHHQSQTQTKLHHQTNQTPQETQQQQCLELTPEQIRYVELAAIITEQHSHQIQLHHQEQQQQHQNQQLTQEQLHNAEDAARRDLRSLWGLTYTFVKLLNEQNTSSIAQKYTEANCINMACRNLMFSTPSSTDEIPIITSTSSPPITTTTTRKTTTSTILPFEMNPNTYYHHFDEMKKKKREI